MADREEQRQAFPFQRINYILLVIAFVVITLGFLLMTGGGNDDPSKFNKEELFSFRRLTLAPITILFGYVLVMVAILKKPKEGWESSGTVEEGEKNEERS
jgi:cytochrome bd-type quinol oxidase subunit 2